MLSIAEATDADDDALVDLWTRCGLVRPWNDARADIARARSQRLRRHLRRPRGRRIVAAVMVGDDGHRGWFYYLAVDPAQRGKGYGRAMTQAGERWLQGARLREGHADGAPGQHQRCTTSTRRPAISSSRGRCSPNGSTAASRRRERYGVTVILPFMFGWNLQK